MTGTFTLLSVVILMAVCSMLQIVSSCPTLMCRCENDRDINMQRINCRHKSFSSIPTFQAEDIPYYELTLAHNRITTIEDDDFNNINITRLDLTNNQIHTISDNAFDPLSSMLEELVLEVNGMQALPVAIHVLTNLRILQLHGFEAAFPGPLPDELLAGLEVLHLSSCGINLLPLSEDTGYSLLELSLRDNRLNSFPSAILAAMPNLHTLDLSDISKEEIQADYFTAQSSLTNLDLSNNGIRTIDDNAFIPQSDTLLVLNLEHNHIDEVQIKCLQPLVKLEELRLAYNDIAALNEALSGLSQLRLLDLQGNKLVFLNTAIMDFLPSSIETLILQENNIRDVYPNSFVQMNSLRILNLDAQGTATGVQLVANSFNGLGDTLEELSLNNIGFTTQWESLQGFTNMKIFKLSHNNITFIPDNALVNLEFLETIHLENNTIETLAQHSFNGIQQNIKTIYLGDNEIQTLPPCLIHGMESLTEITLDNNPLHCDCELSWLSDWVDAQPPITKQWNSWACATPSERPFIEEPLLPCEDDAVVCADIWIPSTAAPTTTPQPTPPPTNRVFTLAFENITSDSIVVTWSVDGYKNISIFAVTHRQEGDADPIKEVTLYRSYRSEEVTDLLPNVTYTICVEMSYAINKNEIRCEAVSTLSDSDPVVSERTSGSNNAGLIAGVVVGVIVVLIILCVVVVLIIMYRKRRQENEKLGFPSRQDMPQVGYNSKRYTKTKKSKLNEVNNDNKKVFLMENGIDNLSPEDRNRILQMLKSSSNNNDVDSSRWSQTSTASNPRYVKDLPPQLPPRPQELEGYLNPVDLRDEDNPDNHLYAEIPCMGDIKECYI